MTLSTVVYKLATDTTFMDRMARNFETTLQEERIALSEEELEVVKAFLRENSFYGYMGTVDDDSPLGNPWVY